MAVGTVVVEAAAVVAVAAVADFSANSIEPIRPCLTSFAASCCCNTFAGSAAAAAAAVEWKSLATNESTGWSAAVVADFGLNRRADS